ncbi:MAG: aldo/keto reductase [Sneathiella sp.]|nr:MAG: aldo/keto reductase [Sneathiella sp.]
MDYVTLGRTNLKVSVAGLGCGGHSRLGQSYGNTEAQSVAVVSAAIDMGVNFIDTAAAYGTEEIVGKAIRGKRDQVVLSTKIPVVPSGDNSLGDTLVAPSDFKRGVEASLKRLGTEAIDILHLHGVAPNQYAQCVQDHVPVLQELRAEGKIRFLGLTERFIVDPQHAMMMQALKDDYWDVIMAGFNMINQSARQRVLAATRDKNIGTLIMFAVRRALGNKDELRAVVRQLVAEGVVDASLLDLEDPLDFLVNSGDARSVIDAAYRYCRHEPGAHVTLTGTGRIPHLTENIASICGAQLSSTHIDRLTEIFGNVDSVSGN